MSSYSVFSASPGCYGSEIYTIISALSIFFKKKYWFCKASAMHYFLQGARKQSYLMP